MVQGIGVQSLVKSYKILKKWYLMPPYLTLRIKGKVEQSRIKGKVEQSRE